MSSEARPAGEPRGEDVVAVQPPAQSVEWSLRARTAVEFADEEARSLGHTIIGSGHLLLGLLREGEGMAAGLLQSFGAHDLGAVRNRVLDELG